MSVQERRLLPRKQAQYLIRFYETPKYASKAFAHTLDLTTQGACIELPDSLPVGASIQFALFTPSNRVIDVAAQVVHVNQSDHLPFHIGIRFTQLASTHRQLLAHELQ